MFSLDNAPKSKARRSSLSHIVDVLLSSFWLDNNNNCNSNDGPLTMSPSSSTSSTMSSTPSLMETEYVSFPDFEEYPTFNSPAHELKGKKSYSSLRSYTSSRDEAYYSSSSCCEDNCELEMEDFDSIRMLL